MLFTTALLTLAAASSALAVDIPISVGSNGSLAFSPSSVTANAGDNLIFTFLAKNHSVTQSTFPAPCTPMPNGVNSGFQFVAPGATQFTSWNISVDDATTPLWFFCAQTVPVVHCNMGMVFAVNAPADKSFAQFQSAAMAAGGGAAASSAPGGTAATSAGVPAPAATSGGASVPSGLSSLPGSPAASTSGFSTVVSSPSNTGTSSSTAASSTTTGNSAIRMNSASGGFLAFVGLVAGLML